LRQLRKFSKARKKGKWAEILPKAVWSHNKIVSRATNFTLFCLLFRAEAVLQEEIKHRSLRTAIGASPCPTEAEDKDLLEPNKTQSGGKLAKISR
jgi:hypothetical protein